MTKRTVTVSETEAVEVQPNELPPGIFWREVPSPHPEAQRLAFVLATTLRKTRTPDLTAEVVRRLRYTVASAFDEDAEEEEILYFPPFEPTQHDLAVIAWTAEFMDNPGLLEQYIEDQDPQ